MVSIFIRKFLKQFKESGVENITFDDVLGYSPFHWVLEFARVYRDGGFDVIVGNPRGCPKFEQ